MDRALEQAPACHRFRALKAESLAHLGRHQEAQELANEILGRDKNSAEAVLVRGLCLYYQDNVELAIQHFQHKAKLFKQKREEGVELVKTGKNNEAYQLYTEALKLDPLNKLTNSKLYCNRAVVCCKLGRLNEAVADCTQALELDETNLKALLRRAKCHMDLQDYEEAVKDYERVCKIDKSRESKRWLQDAKLELKRSKRKDYYKILGIERNATEEEIKKAYRKRALDHHPDRHANATDHEKKEQEKKFKEVGEAYGVLLDPKKRSRYDNGQDMDDDMEGRMDPSHLFNVFYGAEMGEGFSFQQQGFPAGFAFHHFG
ncbi:hypothetical protein B566_EDAN009261 [Ephemera danica]|nr:hypothetical protein B566_EDAN009261 [Ephemera danica]